VDLRKGFTSPVHINGAVIIAVKPYSP
jgi:hypothetical protein